MLRWTVLTSSGPAADFHERELIPGGATNVDEGTVHIHHTTRPALVFGSAQRPDELIDRAAAVADGWDVCRRRSGGGLVVVVPDEQVWIDLVIPAGHRLWNDDVNKAFDWVGAAWLDTVVALGLVGVTRHTGPLTDRADGRILCFAGLGPGELSVDDEPGRPTRKVVGLSQRRTRSGARFQTMLALADDQPLVRPFAGEALARLLDHGNRRRAGWPAGLAAPSPSSVADELVSRLHEASTTAS